MFLNKLGIFQSKVVNLQRKRKQKRMKSIEEKAKAYDIAVERAAKFRKEYLNYKELNVHKGVIEAFNSIFPELKESEDERIRKWLIYYFKEVCDNVSEKEKKGVIAWLEKQEQHKKFRDSIQVGDKVTRNEDGVLVNLSQLDRVAKKDEKQGEQKPVDKVEPKFHEGDWVVSPNGVYWHIDKISNNRYEVTSNTGESSDWNLDTNIYHRFTIQDAKAGDVLICKGELIYSNGIKYERICLFNNLDSAFFTLTKTSNFVEEYDIDVNIDYPDNTVPATKEQKEIIFMAMKDAGYEFDFEKKELKKIEQKSAWSEEDENILNNILFHLKDNLKDNEVEFIAYKNWLKSLRPKNTWKPSDEQMNILEYYMHTLVCNEHKEILFGLYADLKKLREG